MGRPLVVAALAEEVSHVIAAEVLVTGVGKAVAAAGLARRLATPPAPGYVINVGTAGAVAGGVSGVVEVSFVTQHDFPYAAIETLVGPVDRGFVLRADAPPAAASTAPPEAVVLATADTFVADVARAAALAATGVHLVDMEAFAYAATCATFGVPMLCVKAVSDSADADAGVSWLDMVDSCARDLGEWVRRHIGGR
jgi:nucleoside phosphorylase